jgi:hypothetical protein
MEHGQGVGSAYFWNPDERRMEMEAVLNNSLKMRVKTQTTSFIEINAL